MERARMKARWTVPLVTVAVLIPLLSAGKTKPSLSAPAVDTVVLPGNMAWNAVLGDALMRAPGVADNLAAEPLAGFRGGTQLVAVYRKAAPAVVVAIAKDSGGSGFFFRRGGWILTNHHVAFDGAISENLTCQLSIYVGRMNARGQMEPENTRLTAEVYKWDPATDLAVLKLVDSDVAAVDAKEHQALDLSEEEPQVGEDVAAVGNRGIGLLWGLKPGNVISIGKLEDNMDLMFMLEHRYNAVAQAMNAPSIDNVKDELRSQMPAHNESLLIEASCNTTHGDSGGPLLNMSGNVVGMTAFGRSEEDTPVSASYFIHRDSIYDFIRHIPPRPMSVVFALEDMRPAEVSVVDRSGNKTMDTLFCYAWSEGAGGLEETLAGVGWDLDEDSDLAGYANSREVFDHRAFDYEVYYINRGSQELVYYDLDNDGACELIRLHDLETDAVREFTYDGRTKSYHGAELPSGATAFLPAEDVPEALRPVYTQAVLSMLNSE